MAGDMMTGTERLWAAIKLEKTDRVPIVPQLMPEPAAHLTGITQAKVAADNAVALDAILKTFDEYGGWDSIYPGTYTPPQLQALGANPMKMRIPGRDLPDDYQWQLVEEETLQPQDYDKISEIGFDRFYQEEYLARISNLTVDDVNREIGALMTTGMRFMEECDKRKVKPFFVGSGMHPFFTLSIMRSMIAFTRSATVVSWSTRTRNVLFAGSTSINTSADFVSSLTVFSPSGGPVPSEQPIRNP